MTDPKATLVDYLQGARDAMIWKLDGVSEHDVRRPLTPTATNLLGLVKHLATWELTYFGDAFGRPSPVPRPWLDKRQRRLGLDMYAAPDESRDEIVTLYRTAWSHAGETFAAHDLEDVGQVAQWGARGTVTLHQMLVHVLAETQRHAGHADVLRELLDGQVGRRAGEIDPDDDWADLHARVAQAAQDAAG